MYKVTVTAESAPRGHQFWTLNGHFDKTFKTFAEAEAYVQKILALQSQQDRDDEYYERFGPLVEIVEVGDDDDFIDADDKELWEVIT